MNIDTIYLVMKVNHGDNRIIGVYGDYDNALEFQKEEQEKADKEPYGDFIHINSHRIEDAEPVEKNESRDDYDDYY